MGVLWQIELRNITSYQRVKTLYISVRGKINSKTRTKYFQIKAPFKPSQMLLANYMSYSKFNSNAKTGTFGIQTWMHY